MPSPRSNETSTDIRITRLEDGLASLTESVKSIASSFKSEIEESAKWRSSVDRTLATSGRLSWNTLITLVPILALVATWVASYVSGVSSKHSAEENRLAIIQEMEGRYAEEGRDSIREEMRRMDDRISGDLSARQKWMMEITSRVSRFESQQSQ